MQDLTLVGVHDDGEHLVLAGPDGQRFRVRVDEPLRAAVRRDRPRLGQLQIELENTLRPRDIQARIRAGESAEQIAAESGLPVEHVRRYEGPVLAEREFVVRQARAVRMRGLSRSDGTVPTLGDLVGERLAAREVEHGEGSWDAWRTEDGSWLVTLVFAAGTRERRARWIYDAQRRQVVPQDDEARWLTDNEPAKAHPGAAVHRRLVPLRSTDGTAPAEGRSHDRVYDIEADGEIRPADRAEHPLTPAAAWPSASTVDLLDSLRERRGRRQRPIEDIAELDEDLLPPAAHPPFSRPEEATDAEVLALPEPGVPASVGARGAIAAPEPSGTASSTTGATVPPGGEPAAGGERPTPTPSRRGKRASVPSWDDIVFGGRRE